MNQLIHEVRMDVYELIGTRKVDAVMKCKSTEEEASCQAYSVDQ